ncbi:MAG: ATP-binding protein [Candidatus Krumholzibacteriia bacterium]
MNDRPDHPPERCQLPRRILTAAGSRLEGRWDEPGAWRTLCEETVAAWCCDPEVRWALLASRGALGDVSAGESARDEAVVWTAAAGAPDWLDDPCGAELWHGLASAPRHLLAGNGPPPLAGGPWAADRDGTAEGWLAVGESCAQNSGLLMMLGLARPVADVPAGDAAAAGLLDCAFYLAPMLGLRRRLVNLAADATTVRAECETLSRLGDLRSHLAAVTAHELKTPLTSITAYAEVLEQQAGDPDFAYGPDFLRVIRSEADRLLRLVDRLLDSSRRGRSQALTEPLPVAVDALVDDVLRTMAPQAGARDLQLVGRVPADLPDIAGDDDLIKQVLFNLLGNALKFTPAGGRVVLAVREDTAMVRVSVSDNGPGIAPRELRAIFQSFYRTRSARKTDGVGLGLSIVREITNLHGGHLDVQSRLGRGTTFSVLLPKVQHHTAATTMLTAAGFDPARQRRVNELSLRLVAELALARGVMLLLPDAAGTQLVAAAAMGLGAVALDLRPHPGDDLHGLAHSGEGRLIRVPSALQAVVEGRSAECGAAMVAPVALCGAPVRGLILATRRQGGGLFGEDDLALLQVLADVVGHAWNAVLAPGTERHQLDRIVEALAAVTGLRRGGVPTVDPLAMRLLSRTGRRLGLSTYEIRLLQYAGALHDTGMVVLDADVVQKPEDLDVDERDHVGRHPQRGLDVLGPLAELPDLQLIIRHHHERVDGRGYPEGRRGDAIPLGARIMAVVDAFFAMIHSRPWREGLPVAAAVQELQAHAGSQFDAAVVAAFFAVLQEQGLLNEPVAEGPVVTRSGR